MNIGMRLHEAPGESFWERLEFARECGYKNVCFDPEAVLPEFTASDAPSRLDVHAAEQVRCAFKLKGLRCSAVICDCDPAAPDAEAVYGAYLRFAKYLNAPLSCHRLTPENAARPVAWAAAAGVSLVVPRAPQALALFPDGVRQSLELPGTPLPPLRPEWGARVTSLLLPADAVMEGDPAVASYLRLAVSRDLPVLLAGIAETTAERARELAEDAARMQMAANGR